MNRAERRKKEPNRGRSSSMTISVAGSKVSVVFPQFVRNFMLDPAPARATARAILAAADRIEPPVDSSAESENGCRTCGRTNDQMPECTDERCMLLVDLKNAAPQGQASSRSQSEDVPARSAGIVAGSPAVPAPSTEALANDSSTTIDAELKEAADLIFEATGSAFMAGEKCKAGDRAEIYRRLCRAGNIVEGIRHDLNAMPSATAAIKWPDDFIYCPRCYGSFSFSKPRTNNLNRCPFCNFNPSDSGKASPVATTAPARTPRTDAILEIASIEDRYLPLVRLSKELEATLFAAQQAAFTEALRKRGLEEAEIRAIVERELDGIDRQELDNGWWPTSVGAAYGEEKRENLVRAIVGALKVTR